MWRRHWVQRGSVYRVSEEEELKATDVTPDLSLMGVWEAKGP